MLKCLYLNVYRLNQNAIMQKASFLGFTLLALSLAACRQRTPSNIAHTDTLHLQDSSLVAPPVVDTPLVPDTMFTPKDSLRVTEAQLLGKWSRPVQGKEGETEGFELKPKGRVRNLRITPYSMIYDSWSLRKDSLVLKSHMQHVAEPVVAVDTSLVTGISDTSLVLFPIRAVQGYEERYTRVGHRK